MQSFRQIVSLDVSASFKQLLVVSGDGVIQANIFVNYQFSII